MPRLPVGELMQRNVALYPMSLPGTPHPARKRAQSDIGRWIASGQRLLSVAARFPLYQADAAHEAVERGDKVGTVVIECAR
jgi:NADPH2:quinone reductase